MEVALRTVTLVEGPNGRRPVRWLIGGQIGLSAGYDFRPGVAAQVPDADAAILADPDRTGGRVFAVTGGKPEPVKAPDVPAVPDEVPAAFPVPPSPKATVPEVPKG